MSLPEAARVAVVHAIERKQEDLEYARHRTCSARAVVQRVQANLEQVQRNLDIAEREERDLRTALGELQTAIRS